MAQDETAGPSTALVVGGFIAVALGTLIASVLYEVLEPALPMLVEGLSPFAAIYVAAQALERLLEPLSPWVRASEKSQAKANFVLASANHDPPAQVAAQRQMAVVRADRAIFFWAAATILAMLLSGSMGLFLLHLIGVTGGPPWLDILVTGLAIGGGTKPLHDLITRIEKGKEKAEKEAAA
ncbi:MAG: hypothetical protein ACR2K0_01930 [Acidimicrobiales bacterium]